MNKKYVSSISEAAPTYLEEKHKFTEEEMSFLAKGQPGDESFDRVYRLWMNHLFEQYALACKQRQKHIKKIEEKATDRIAFGRFSKEKLTLEEIDAEIEYLKTMVMPETYRHEPLNGSTLENNAVAWLEKLPELYKQRKQLESQTSDPSPYNTKIKINRINKAIYAIREEYASSNQADDLVVRKTPRMADKDEIGLTPAESFRLAMREIKKRVIQQGRSGTFGDVCTYIADNGSPPDWLDVDILGCTEIEVDYEEKKIYSTNKKNVRTGRTFETARTLMQRKNKKKICVIF